MPIGCYVSSSVVLRLGESRYSDSHGGRQTPVTRFVLLSTQRSGTSYLMERLAAHPAIGGYGEALLPASLGPFEWPDGAGDRLFYSGYRLQRGHSARFYSHLDLFGYINHLYEPRRDFRAIGFKLMYDEARPYPELLPFLKLRGVRVLHLVRNNLLDLFLSRETVMFRRFVHARSPHEREVVSIEVDTDKLVSRLQLLARQQQFARRVIRTLRMPSLELTYEDIVADESSVRRAVRFLGVSDEGVDLPAKMLKVSPSQKTSTANWDEVAARLRGTSFEHFLESG